MKSKNRLKLSKGALIESYLAEEAIGLAKSLDWHIVKGPFWKKENDIHDPVSWKDEVDDPKRSIYHQYRNKNSENYKSELKKSLEKENIKDGDFVYAGKIKGIYYNGGILGGGSESESEDIYDEWKNILLRESLANSSLVKVKNIKASTFFTKGRLNEICQYLQHSKADVIFVNTTLSFVQKRNLEIYLNNFINEKNERIRAYNIKSALKSIGDATDTESNFSNIEISSEEHGRRIKILDRFNIILSIFSQRAKSRASQLQIELAYLKYLKTRLNRGGNANFGSLYKEFGGDFLSSYNDVSFEVVSGKQSSGRGSLGGSGETQLELEKRKVGVRESQIKEILEELKERRKIEREIRRDKSTLLPTVALLGYTNAGKTALMNKLANTTLESENKLFQTLNTTLKKIMLPSKQNALLLDTVGFITDLPHELVESFKSTLEEVFSADILLHVIDVSNPNHIYQKGTVYKILNELFPKKSQYNTKVIEVWNKIDLINDINMISGYIAESEYPIVPISVKSGVNIDMLYSEVINKLNFVLGKELKEIRCKSEDYDKLFKWLKENIGQPSEVNYDEETFEMVLSIPMSAEEFERYLENFIIMRENKKGKLNK
jgi:small GTP-binding protein